MSTKLNVRFAPDWTLPSVWTGVASQARLWLERQQLQARDAVLLLPFAALLAPMRVAWAEQGGWQIRIETTQTLAASLGPPPTVQPGACSGDLVLDRLNAAALLRSQRALGELAQSDTQVFEHMVGRVVEAAQAFRAAAWALPPTGRVAFWKQARQALSLPATSNPGPALEARLLAMALEWAVWSSDGQACPLDALHQLPVSAWIVVRLGGPDEAADAAAQASAAPALWLDLDPAFETSYQPEQRLCPPQALQTMQRWTCPDFEAEAQAVAAMTLQAINEGRVPVALVAVDRALVRRVRALLQRQQVPVLDETGWLLATTPGGARLLALLQAAQALRRAPEAQGEDPRSCPASSRDAVLDWLKSQGLDKQAASRLEVDALEGLWRDRRRPVDVAAANRCWSLVWRILAPLLQPSTASLQEWLQLTHSTLQACRGLELLESEPSGRQILMALHLQNPSSAAWEQAAQGTRLNLDGFVAWAGSSLEQSPYLPLPDEQALVVMTPLARAYGRAFGQVLLPGADHVQLAAPGSPPSLIGPGLARLLGMPDVRQRHHAQRLSLLHLTRGAPLSVTRRLKEGGEDLSISPDMAWLLQATQAAAPSSPQLSLAGGHSTEWQAWTPASGPELTAQPVAPPQPRAPDNLPQKLSASQLDAYRTCPYKFYARAVLKLDEPEELDAALSKRDYGNWLHELLHRFHSRRDYREPSAGQLHAAAQWASTKLGLSEAELLPWRASFEHFVPRYLAWMEAREGEGWFWADGETDFQRGVEDLPGTTLRGRLDRLDHGSDGEQWVIDYKTGSVADLKKRVARPLEDTQLAFYAALLVPSGADAQTMGPTLRAAYLALDDENSPLLIEHQQVAATAKVMVQALADEWQRLREGEALQALGEGRACDLCEARGLCRKDHWAPPTEAETA